MNISSRPQGISHLMEAATVLAKLTDCAPVPYSRTVPDHQRTEVSNSEAKPAAPQRSTIIDEEEDDCSKEPCTPECTAVGSKAIFPERLMAILNDKSLADVVTWLPHGRSFAILRPDFFTEHVLPKFVPPVDARGSTKYPSFTRKLNRWGFRQATRGPDTGAFHHPLFRLDKPDMCLEMICQRSRDRKGSKKSNLPAKKRPVVLLTKESLQAMNEEETTRTTSASPQTEKQHAAVSISDDSHSMRSTLSSSPAQQQQQPSVEHLQQRIIRAPAQQITNDADLVQRALAQRNEEERIRVAKDMLYHAYIQAMQA